MTMPAHQSYRLSQYTDNAFVNSQFETSSNEITKSTSVHLKDEIIDQLNHNSSNSYFLETTESSHHDASIIASSVCAESDANSASALLIDYSHRGLDDVNNCTYTAAISAGNGTPTSMNFNNYSGNSEMATTSMNFNKYSDNSEIIVDKSNSLPSAGEYAVVQEDRSSHKKWCHFQDDDSNAIENSHLDHDSCQTQMNSFDIEGRNSDENVPADDSNSGTFKKRYTFAEDSNETMQPHFIRNNSDEQHFSTITSSQFRVQEESSSQYICVDDCSNQTSHCYPDPVDIIKHLNHGDSNHIDLHDNISTVSAIPTEIYLAADPSFIIGQHEQNVPSIDNITEGFHWYIKSSKK